MSDQEITAFERKVEELIVEFRSDPEAAKRFEREANEWPVPTWENSPGAAERVGVKLVASGE